MTTAGFFSQATKVSDASSAEISIERFIGNPFKLKIAAAWQNVRVPVQIHSWPIPVIGRSGSICRNRARSTIERQQHLGLSTPLSAAPR
jgi:hypothetical protein